MKKISYRVKNWKSYNRSLIQRGNLTLWFSEESINDWYHQCKGNRKRGRCFTYSASTIELALTLRTLFRFSLRATQGFLEGLVSLLGLKLRVLHYSQLSRRASDLSIQLSSLRQAGKLPTDLVVDSTGLKIFGEGEWKARTHGKQKRRTWRKYHVTVNPASHEVTAVELTQSNVHDGTVLSTLLSGQKNIGKIYGDGAYSFKQNFDAIAELGAIPLIPVRSGTALVEKNPSKGEQLRNQLIEDAWKIGGQFLWKKHSGYHRRS